ncbi:unnamed protein product [Brugia pahangi]|uniref:Integral membrane protein n=1 Tax=Brugia pahangi TaxID=6280 RepID=A0A0N4TP37_BRUPA|nr:unnamed protein product [Brugia pahangi]
MSATLSFLFPKGCIFAVSKIEEVRIENEFKARTLVTALTSNERKLLQAVLGNLEKQFLPIISNGKYLSRQQTYQLFLVNSIPFIGFGFLDNVIMLVAGEYGQGRLILFSLSFFSALKKMNFSFYLESFFVRVVTNLRRSIGLIAGCLIGMFPLLFFDSTNFNSKTKIQDRTDENDG